MSLMKKKKGGICQIGKQKQKTKKFKKILYNFYSFFALSAFFSDLDEFHQN
jgi:F0F1-type ATP synthase alpha subunit